MRNLTDPHYNDGSSYQSLQTEEPPVNPFASDNDNSSDNFSFHSEQQHMYHDNPPQPPPHSRSPFDDSNQRPPSVASQQYYDQQQQHGGQQYDQYLYSPDASAPMMRDFSSGSGGQTQQQQNMVSRQSSASLSGLNSEYDRYPNRISSAAPSIVSGAPLLHPNAAAAGGAGAIAAGGAAARHSTMSDETASSISSNDASNPFIVNADFSPFGGYPASSFPLHLEEKEADDYLHNPDPILDAKEDRRCQGLDRRGWGALIAFVCLFIGGIMVFIILPVLTFSGVTEHGAVTKKVEHLTDYEYGILGGIRTDLVDEDTPDSAKYHTSKDNEKWELVFSDEFNKEGRTFYEGDDQFFQAQDFHYAGTQDLEWYDPDAAITEKGALTIQLDAYENHDLFYRSAMLQSWNKLCFSDGYLEVSANLPGHGDVPGLWPGIWTMANLCRPGFLASTEGLWPYSYEACDAGITANQSSPDGISYLPGQRLNSCTCPGHDHPNEGTGRGCPEIDALEGTVDTNGVASQSLQTAPMDIWYMPDYNFIEVNNKSVSAMNTYCGGPLQQAVSATTTLNHEWYEYPPSSNPDQTWKRNFQSFGFEYKGGYNDGYIRWFVGNDPEKDWTMTMYGASLGPNGNIASRPISKESMSIVLNLGISNSWTSINWPDLTWPSKMRVDYVRIYQPAGATSLSCDPDSHPTYDYIKDHINIYTNPNLTAFEQGGYRFPPTKLLDQC